VRCGRVLEEFFPYGVREPLGVSEARLDGGEGVEGIVAVIRTSPGSSRDLEGWAAASPSDVASAPSQNLRFWLTPSVACTFIAG